MRKPTDLVAYCCMNSFWKGVLSMAQARQGSSHHSPYATGRIFRRIKVKARRILVDVFLLSIAVAAAGFGLKGFLLPSHFIDGGAVGVALLASVVTGWPLSSLLVVINLPFILLGYRAIGREFAVKTAVAIFALSLVVEFVPYPHITADKLLVAVFGGFFIGMGTGLAVRGGGVIDGSEVMAINLSRQKGLSIGDIVLIINVLIFAVAAYLISMEAAMYSILTYLAASKTMTFIIEGIEEYTGVTIISIKPEEIRKMIVYQLGRGVTIYNGKRGYGKRGDVNENIDIVFTVVTRLEVNQLNQEIEKIDPNAFVIMDSIKDTKGGMIKKRRLSH